jgi:myo-inositol-1(or 4)-monophosphatase
VPAEPPRSDSDPLGGVDWLALCRRVVEAQRALFSATPTAAGRSVYEGVGEGGDKALAIDRRCEDAVFAELEALGLPLRAIAEERGEVAIGDGSGPTVVIDPIDGSMNARRTIPAHSVSIAVASGPTMADAEFGYVYDFGRREEFSARRGAGARLGDDPLRAEGIVPGLEVVGLESTKPEWLVPVVEGLAGKTYRVRAVGSIAISLCWVAAGRFDGMLTARNCRSVDAAAAQLIVREAGGSVGFGDGGLEDAALSLDARYPLAGALDDERLAALLEIQRDARTGA